MSESAFLRARRPEHKRQRREAILAAARGLAAESGVRGVSLGDVAAAVGLAKSNVVRYFGSREEIFLELAAEGWREWADDVVGRLRRGDDAIDALAETHAERPLFCDLIGQIPATLEHNISVPVARDFKRMCRDITREVGAEVAAARPDLTDSEADELVSAAHVLAGTLHPLANPAPTMVQVYRHHPELAGMFPAFLPTLRRTLAALAAGLPTLRP
ncbi:TetR/AcrR family transcriptional regulator [Marinitenerispora sediminis]|uniref:TetR/AcrR family transcriptional regulator n=1 Tax=Marinitenerispora sediminis TaxID=1931232 RepID=A0A368T3S4_9ACTN|nr:TetR family transcriptional regulator [Marinitenerispora sediminis]RCV49500.1 TetR/AcrR family transcriptional regulator [Marinitenerispora sediminis]RCV52597.1 TetR/AcrR family transcriptional regulator [Marinitenerispora sediminis]RCV56871.1 TetR/AcrR family transcriptional regulator [Marinitenerispora sediminis]